MRISFFFKLWYDTVVQLVHFPAFKTVAYISHVLFIFLIVNVKSACHNNCFVYACTCLSGGIKTFFISVAGQDHSLSTTL